MSSEPSHERVPERVAIFMPWYSVPAPLRVGPLCLAPYAAATPSLGLSEAEHTALARVLSSYRDARGEPVSSFTLVSFADRAPLAGLNADAREEAFEVLELFKGACLASRQLSGTWGHAYCNSDLLVTVGHGIDVKSAFITVITKTATGFIQSINDVSAFRFSTPPHVAHKMSPKPDEKLLASLLTLRGEADATNESRRLWARVADASNAFILANTDVSAFRQHQELVLLVGGLQRLLDAESKEEAMARALETLLVPTFAFVPSPPVEDVDEFENQVRTFPRTDVTPRAQWMRELYRLRNEYAHGNSAHRRASMWTLMEHLFAARVIYPLVLKAVLAREGRYTFTKTDQDRIDTFERFICYPSLYSDGQSGLSIEHAESWLLSQQMRARWMELAAERAQRN